MIFYLKSKKSTVIPNKKKTCSTLILATLKFKKKIGIKIHVHILFKRWSIKLIKANIHVGILWITLGEEN